MIALNVRVNSRLNLSGAGAIVRSEIEAAMQRSVLHVEGQVKPLTPVKTGTLRRSVHGAVENGGRSGRVGTPLIYARFIETGVRRGRRGSVRRRAGPARMFERGLAMSTHAIKGYFEQAGRLIAGRVA